MHFTLKTNPLLRKEGCGYSYHESVSHDKASLWLKDESLDDISAPGII